MTRCIFVSALTAVLFLPATVHAEVIAAQGVEGEKEDRSRLGRGIRPRCRRVVRFAAAEGDECREEQGGAGAGHGVQR